MPRIHLQIDGNRWRVDTDNPVELAIPLDFHGKQPRAFSMSGAASQPVEAGDFVGDTRRGGSVNCERLRLTPHGNGTHTEGVGHLTEERIFVGDVVSEPLIPTTVLTVEPRRFGDVDETYRGDHDADDRVLCRADLADARSHLESPDEFLTAVVIRVDDTATGGIIDYSGTNPPYPTDEAVDWLRDVSCDHVLLESPSLDRESDGGTVPNHHRFFGIEPNESPGESSRRRTVTEMIMVPEHLDDGPYVLSLRFPRFRLDAAPSRPVIYSVTG